MALMELKTKRYNISVDQLVEGGPGGYESVYLTSEGEPASAELYELLSEFSGELLPVVNGSIRQRNGIALLNALNRKDSIGIASGFKPSGAYHFGHKLTSSAVSFFQKNGAQIFIPVADIECSMDPRMTKEQYEFWAADNLLDWGANGVNLDAAHVYLQSEEHRVNQLAYLVARSLNFEFAADIYGMDKLVSDFPFLFAGITQVGDILLPQHTEFGNDHSFMVSGQDQDGHMKMTVALVEESLKNSIVLPGVRTVPSGFYIPHIRGIRGNKASSSKPQDTLYLGSGPAQEDLDARINSTLKKFDDACKEDKENLEKCALDMVRYIDVFEKASNVEFRNLYKDDLYINELVNKLDAAKPEEKKVVQEQLDHYLISICKDMHQNNIELVRDLLPQALSEHQMKRQAVLDYAKLKPSIVKVQAQESLGQGWGQFHESSSNSEDPNLPEFWKVPKNAIVDKNKRNPTDWYTLVNKVANKLMP
ncbi:hypothetical protein COV13_02085 [Candidatus Woesearchaeota archaeon CG10_big_fil_rev_8_21_14_0_10_32_9]|nr:MAG: hypothetical protein COV13_02085 [Candidatus Woesearchaeota archaeon CG10_big_fil_rev_8_21_14_0_10_32_9]